MTSLRVLFCVAALASIGCAKQSMSTRWALTPVLGPANPGATEFERRENERREEIALRSAERTELTTRLQELGVWVDRDPDLFDNSAQWKDMTPALRTDVAVGLDRVLTLSRRINVMTGRDDNDDAVIRRGLKRLKSLRKYAPEIPAYYGH